MNLKTIRLKTEIKDLLLSNIKNFETPIQQTYRKPEETPEFKMNKPREIFHYNTPIQIAGDWMIGLTDLELNYSIYNISEQNNKFQLFTNPLDSEFSFTELKDKIAEILGLSSLTPEDVEHETTAPDFFTAYRGLVIEESQTDGYYFILLKYPQSHFRDFESYLRDSTGLTDDNIELFLK